MTNSDEDSANADYDEILRKLDALLHKHQDKSSASAKTHDAAPLPVITPGIAVEQPSLTSADNIPTLTETVHLTPTMLSPQSDVTSLLGQILDSALKDSGAELDAGAREALIQALECRLFGL
ncbi:MAG: hypothetical protein L0H15_01220 [Nitrosospira sp.]|nr:hypothetical protein [Nitrosospira sp.]MDN5880733.1 hypothetical protein [Nitrosospira sp.]MDN5935084.1 hypothetical protein [Nitrosospira sp.]